MSVNTTALLLVALLSCAGTAVLAAENIHWGYSGLAGAEHWGN